MAEKISFININAPSLIAITIPEEIRRQETYQLLEFNISGQYSNETEKFWLAAAAQNQFLY